MPDDATYMKRALTLAKRGEGRVEPNPMVGCVLVRDGGVVGEGWHRKFGQAHAEVEAIRAAGHAARGASAFVTLEPCAHTGKTPPCVEALCEAGVARVAVAMVDPYEQVAGRGIERLRDAGIAVQVGLMEAEASRLNRPFIKRVTRKLPWAIAKWAQTLDGRIATRTGDSKWISGEQARQWVHRLRARVDAVMVGIGTVIADDPQLTARNVTVRRPAARVVIDPSLRIAMQSKLVQSANETPVLIACRPDAAAGREAASLRSAGITIMPTPTIDHRLDLRAVMHALCEDHAATNVLIEGGGRLIGEAIAQGVVDEAAVFVAPKLLGDDDAVGAVTGWSFERIAEARVLSLESTRRVGDDVLLRYRVGDADRGGRRARVAAGGRGGSAPLRVAAKRGEGFGVACGYIGRIMMNDNRLTRREAIKLGAVATTAAAVPVGCGRSTDRAALDAAAAKSARPKTPRNIIFMVSDGMNHSVPLLADALSQQVRGRGTRWRELLQRDDVTHGMLANDSGSSMVTDSAAASSAWSSGQKVPNGRLNVLADGARLAPLATYLKKVNKHLGLVTTDAMCGATPAGFAAVSEDRGASEMIAMQYLELADVLMGGGRLAFDALGRADRQDLMWLYQSRGYRIMVDRSTLLSSQAGERVLGLFADEKLPYTIDHTSDAELRRRTPTLAEMTRHALTCLQGRGEGFLLQVEGARIDHAGHANDIAAQLWDQIAFDDAVIAAMNFAEQDGETLVLVCTDHGTGGPSLCGVGGGYNDTTEHFSRIATAKGSFERLRQVVTPHLADADAAAAKLQQQYREQYGFELTDDQSATVAEAFTRGVPDELNRQHRNAHGALGQILGNHYSVQWTGVSHTADWGMATAVGPGAARFSGLRHHIDVWSTLADMWRFPTSQTTPAAAAATG